jgi:hypothetical protein
MAVGSYPAKCRLYGAKTKKGKTIFTTDTGFGVVVIRDVKIIYQVTVNSGVHL